MFYILFHAHVHVTDNKPNFVAEKAAWFFFFNHLTFFRITYFKYIVKHQVIFLAENVHYMLNFIKRLTL